MIPPGALLRCPQMKWPMFIVALAVVGASLSMVRDDSVTVSPVDHLIYPDIDAYFREAPVLGIVNARQVGRARTVRVYASLHGLQPDTTYRVVASRRPCSQRHRSSARVFTADVSTAPGSDDAYRARRVRRSGSLDKTRSVRVLSLSSAGEIQEQGCAAWSGSREPSPSPTPSPTPG